MEVVITKSTNKNKKFDANVDGKQISFGAAGYSEFSIHKDETRKERYIARHRKNENGVLMVLKHRGFIPDGFYGICLPLNHQ